MFGAFIESNIWTRTSNASFENEYSYKARRAIERSATLTKLKALAVFIRCNVWNIQIKSRSIWILNQA